MIIQGIGWAGTLLYLANHAYISFHARWKAPVYYGGNLAAALSLAFTSAVLASWQAVVINIFWALVSLLSLGGRGSVKFSGTRRWLDFPCLAFLLITLGCLTTHPGLTSTLLGWSSAYIFCAAYLLFSAGCIPPQVYFFYNAYAAAALLPRLFQDQNWPAFGLEVAWATLSIIATWRKKDGLHLLG